MREVIDFNQLKVSGTLPSPKGIALKVIQLCQDENLSLREMAQTIQGDPALAGRVIRIANYANPNRSRPIASVTTDTLILIGIHAVRQVVLGLSLVGNYRDGRCKLFDYERFWSHSVAVGSAAQVIASAIQVAAPAEMFNCGLMSGVGQLALATVRPEAYCEMLSSLPDDTPEALYEAQRHHFGLTQRDMTTFMLQDWGIPKLFIDALYYHEDPLASGYAENSRPLRITCTLQLASLMARACMNTNIDEELISRINTFGACLQLEPDQLEVMIEQTKVEWKDWCNMLDIHVTPGADKVALPKMTETTPPPLQPLPDESGAAQRRGTSLRVMIASNNELQSNMLKKAVAGGGHEIIVVDKGQKALELVPQWHPHVLIADWLLPEIDGLSLCRMLRKMPAGEKLYCMIVTQFEDERRKIDAYESGADDLLRSPINPRLVITQLSVAQRHATLHGLA